MKKYHMLCITTMLVLLQSFYIERTRSAYLPVLEEYNLLNQLEGLRKDQQSQRHSYVPSSSEYQYKDNSNSADGAVRQTVVLGKKEQGRGEITTAEDSSSNNNAAMSASYTDTNEETDALGNWQLLPHGSYDKNYDVGAGNTPVHAVAWSAQRSAFHAYENSDMKTKFDSDESDADGDDSGIDLEDVENNKEANNAHILSRKRRGFDDWLIAPHTRWCGRGNTANNNYNQLGNAADADRCCRRHDHCPIFISSFSSRYNLFNYRPYTLSHCSCDRRFRACLKMNNDDPSNTIGQLFFNMVPSQCFIIRNEHKCLEYDEEGKCVKETTIKRAYVRENKKY
ncbi:uncharacterized protein LOC101455906 [Ceratitis capitata]|uniref:phospholipase A2 n=1 Tax=Ceratitis capitata TaxID=7213 RepID=W8C1H0_CERCA|nr:uncharacterized protein LOC101455906 [Ceratitis capitata]